MLHLLADFRRRVTAFALTLAAAGVAAACAEDLEGGAACPALCPVTNEQVRDTLLDPVVLDTALAGVPIPGDAPVLLVAVRPGPDSLDVRAVMRFDSLPAFYAPPAGGDSVAITTLDSTLLRVRLDTSGTRLAQSARLEAYDVDTTTTSDTAVATLGALFRPERLLGSTTFAQASVVGDSVRLFLDNGRVAARARAGGRLRIGLRLVSGGAAQLRVLGVSASGVSGAFAPVLRFDPSADTSYRPLSVSPASTTPAEPTLASAFLDQTIVVRGAGAAAGSDLVIGGLPARRVYLRFDVPSALVDSSRIVRAGLVLVQRPARGYRQTDSVAVRRLVGFATAAVVDLVRASDVATSPDTLTFSYAATDSGAREIPVVNAVAAWRALPAGSPRTIVLRSSSEGQQAAEVRFFSTEGPAGLRPRLRLSYIPRTSFGIP